MKWQQRALKNGFRSLVEPEQVRCGAGLSYSANPSDLLRSPAKLGFDAAAFSLTPPIDWIPQPVRRGSARSGSTGSLAQFFDPSPRQKL